MSVPITVLVEWLEAVARLGSELCVADSWAPLRPTRHAVVVCQEARTPLTAAPRSDKCGADHKLRGRRDISDHHRWGRSDSGYKVT
jgi:hypothetical protein